MKDIPTTFEKRVFEKFDKLKTYCETEGFKGWDPYDGLNSKVFQYSPLKYSRFFRLLWIQFFKRSQINFRNLFLVPKEYNAKGLGLFLTAYCNLYRISPSDELKNKIELLALKLIELQSKGFSGACWGYNFDWQARAFLQPRYTPTVVATTFIAYAFLDAYDIFKKKEWLDIARSSCEFILNDLNRTYDNDGDFAFSYSPLDKTTVFNASLLGSKLLARVHSYTTEDCLLEPAKRSVSFCCKHQKKDGSWAYSTLPYHYWIDNFHTGFNLEAIAEYQKYSGDKSFDKNLHSGLDFYLANFFLEDGTPKYYNDKTYPVDIHSPAQLIITLFRTQQIAPHSILVEKVIDWTFRHMFDEKKGYFYYQLKSREKVCKIPYMRWAQAWMMYAMSFLLSKEVVNKKH